MEKVTQEKRWQKVAMDMGYSSQNKNLSSLLRAHYERILYPLDVFEREEQKKAAAALKEEMVRKQIRVVPSFRQLSSNYNCCFQVPYFWGLKFTWV